MNSFIKNNKTARKRYISVYRGILSVFAVLSITACLVLNAGKFFTPENIRAVNIGEDNIFKVIPADPQKHSIPENEGLHEDELFFIDENKESTDEAGNISVPDGNYPILPLDMSADQSPTSIKINDTDSNINIDPSYYLSRSLPESLKGTGTVSVSAQNEPLVLILHTHATECYTEEGASSYDPDTSFRSSDPEKNMIAVGEVFADTLELNGIPTIHCQVLHDEESYNASYTRSLESVKYYLNKYPSIRYVFDLHRDAIIRENGDMIKTECSVDGATSAQMMSVVGTNALGADHPNWHDNMTLAIKLQSALISEYPDLARPVNTRGASFNQQYAPGSLLFEIGSCGNTLDEAKRCAVYLAEALSDIINNE